MKKLRKSEATSKHQKHWFSLATQRNWESTRDWRNCQTPLLVESRPWLERSELASWSGKPAGQQLPNNHVIKNAESMFTIITNKTVKPQNKTNCIKNLRGWNPTILGHELRTEKLFGNRQKNGEERRWKLEREQNLVRKERMERSSSPPRSSISELWRRGESSESLRRAFGALHEKL